MTSHFLSLLTFLGSYHLIPAIIVILGVFSITRLLVEDTLFDRPRNWFFDHFPHDGYTTKKIPKRGKYNIISNGYHLVTKGTYLGKLMSCAWCAGFWVALGIYVALLLSPVWTTFVLFPLALRVIPALMPGWG